MYQYIVKNRTNHLITALVRPNFEGMNWGAGQTRILSEDQISNDVKDRANKGQFQMTVVPVAGVSEPKTHWVEVTVNDVSSPEALSESEMADKMEYDTRASEESDEPAEDVSESEQIALLMKNRRGKLNEIAASLGVEKPENYATKRMLAERVVASQKP